jgi:uncharacterized membrane protein YccC
MHLLKWLGQRDLGLAALRRAGRSAIVMPGLFAIGDKVIGNADVATFAAFGSFAMLLLVDFGGPMRERLQAQLGLAVVGGVFVVVGTLASQNAYLAAGVMALIGFGVLFVGVVSSVLAGATTALLLALILPITLTAHPSQIPHRLEGWGMASAAALIAIAVLWPAPARHPLRPPAIAASRALASRLRAEVGFARDEVISREELDRAVEKSNEGVLGLQRAFLATPYRPTGLSTVTRTVVRLVDEMAWLTTVVQSTSAPGGLTANPATCAVKIAAASVLERSAEVLESSAASNVEDLHNALASLQAALGRMETNATAELPVRRIGGDEEQSVTEVVTSLDPSFRAQEISFIVSLIGRNVELTAAAEQRGWLDRLLGRQPEGLAGALSAAQERAAAHVERHSVWLHNSVRGAAGLGLAVLVANLSGVQHSFWVVLGTLSVLRSNALNTGQNVLRGLLGTVIGFVIGGALVEAVGTNESLLWFLLPVAILFAGVAPAAISFAAGQAAFTLTLVILYNIIEPAGWRVGLLRVEDIAIGCAVSLVVGLLFWPRGAAAALSQALATAYTDSATYLTRAVEFGMVRCDAGSPLTPPPTDEATRAAAAGRRLDDTYRSYLAERGSKPLALSEVTRLVTGVAGLRLAGDAVLDLWQREDGAASGDRAAAREALLNTGEQIRSWYNDLAVSLVNGQEMRFPLAHDKQADSKLIEAIRHDLRGSDGAASGTAVRMIWTADHLDAARRLQGVVFDPAREAAEQRREGPFEAMLPKRMRHHPHLAATSAP